MTSTNFNIGLGDTNRNSSKVLKPPGGGSSDIFGASEGVQHSPRRAHANHLQSSVFGTNGTTETTATRRSKPGNDSHSRLFGPLESRPQSTPVNRMRSNIPFGVTEGGSDVHQTGNTTAAKSGAIQNGQQETSTPAGGNPVTGDGYVASVANEEKGTPPSPPAAMTNNGTGNTDSRRNRVPPGGFSSGLW